MSSPSIIIPGLKLTEKEYTSLNFQITLSNKPFIIRVIIIIIATLGIMPAIMGDGFNRILFFTLFPVCVLVWLPIRIVIASKKQLASNPWLNQPLDYEITPSQIRLQGNGLAMETSWNSVHSVKELKHWYVIYTAQQQGYFLPKNRFTAEQEAGLREIIKSLAGRIRINLK